MNRRTRQSSPQTEQLAVLRLLDGALGEPGTPKERRYDNTDFPRFVAQNGIGNHRSRLDARRRVPKRIGFDSLEQRINLDGFFAALAASTINFTNHVSQEVGSYIQSTTFGQAIHDTLEGAFSIAQAGGPSSDLSSAPGTPLYQYTQDGLYSARITPNAPLPGASSSDTQEGLHYNLKKILDKGLLSLDSIATSVYAGACWGVAIGAIPIPGVDLADAAIVPICVSLTADALKTVALNAAEEFTSQSIDMTPWSPQMKNISKTVVSGISLIKDLYDFKEPFDDARALLNDVPTIGKHLKEVVAIGTTITTGFLDVTKETVAQLIKTPKADSGSASFLNTCLLVNSIQSQYRAIATASVMSDKDSPLNDAAKQDLRLLNYDNQSYLATLGVDQDTATKLIGILGADSSGFTTIQNRNLLIRGTDAADTIVVARDGVNANLLDVTINGSLRQFHRNSIDSLSIYARAGNDDVTVNDDLTTTIYGGTGDDHILGGQGQNTIYGGPGNNVLQSRGTSDVLRGGAGINKMWSGPGSAIFDTVGTDDTVLNSATVSFKDVVAGWNSGAAPAGHPPSITSISFPQGSQLIQGAKAVLSALGVGDNGVSVDRVEFYNDANSDGIGDASEWIDADSSLRGGWSISVDTTGLTPGPHVILGRSVGKNFESSPWVKTTLTVLDPNSAQAKPDLVATKFDATYPYTYGWGQLITVDYRFANNGSSGVTGLFTNGLYLSKDAKFDASDVSLSRQTITGIAAGAVLSQQVQFALPSSTPAGYSDGPLYLLLVLDDGKVVTESNESNNSGTGEGIDFRAVSVSGAPVIPGAPTIGSFTITPSTFVRGVNVTLTASDVKDDGVVNSVTFYLDTNGNGNLDGGDLKINEASKSGTTFTLVASTANWPLGSVFVFAQAQDNFGNNSLVKSFAVSVQGNGPSVPDRFESNDTLATATYAGAEGTFTFPSLSITQGDVDQFIFDVPVNAGAVDVKINFFQEATGAGDLRLEIQGVTFLGSKGFSDTSTAGNTQERISKTLSAGRYVAVVAGYNTNPNYTLTIQVSSLPGAPKLGTFSATPSPVLVGSDLLLSVDTVTGFDNSPDHGVAFYRDINHDAQISDDEYLGVDFNTGDGPNGQYQFKTSTLGWPIGTSTILAFAFNPTTIESVARSLPVIVRANQPPVIGGFLVPNAATRGDKVTLVAQNVTDDESVSGVQFFRDANGNGTFDGGDPSLGTATKNGTDWSLGNIDTTTWALGTNRVFARAVDNRNVPSPILSSDITLGKRPPSIGSLSLPVQIIQGDSFTATAKTVADADGTVGQVAFYADTNFDGLLGNGDTLLGIGTKNGSDWNLLITATGPAWVPGALLLFAQASDDSSPALSSNIPKSLSVIEVNLPPILAAIGNQSVNAGTALGFKAEAVDPNPGQSIRFSLDSSAPIGPTIDPLSGVFSWTPTADQGGKSYSITVRATDNGLPSLSDSKTITVAVATPLLTVSSFLSDPSGFTSRFSRPLDTSVLNLYDTATGGFGSADVTVTGAATGPVLGSLFVSPDNQAVMFVKTGGVLAPDTYTVTLRSATNGFKGTGGDLLDGDGDGSPGGNYVGTFTVAASTARVISLPDFAGGPGQAVNVPATASGLPLSISDASGVTSITFDLLYNPSLLTVTAANLGAGVSPSASVSVDLSTSGIARVTFLSPTPLASGPLTFATLTASIPTTTVYASKEVLTFANLVVNGGAIVVKADDAVHVDSYVGDVTRNGGYSGLDLSFMLRIIVGLDGGFAGYLDLDPRILADITRDGTISGLDVTRLRQFIVGLNPPQVPPLPSGFTLAPAVGQDPIVRIPRDLIARVGETVTVPVELLQTDTSAIGLSAFDFVIRFDPTRFTAGNVRLGPSAAGFVLGSSIDAQRGRIIITASKAVSTEIAPGTVGKLVLIDFAVKDGASVGWSSINLLGSDDAVDQTRITSLNEGRLVLSPAPSNAADDPVDGLIRIVRVAPPAQVKTTVSPFDLSLVPGGMIVDARPALGVVAPGSTVPIARPTRIRRSAAHRSETVHPHGPASFRSHGSNSHARPILHSAMTRSLHAASIDINPVYKEIS